MLVHVPSIINNLFNSWLGDKVFNGYDRCICSYLFIDIKHSKVFLSKVQISFSDGRDLGQTTLHVLNIATPEKNRGISRERIEN